MGPHDTPDREASRPTRASARVDAIADRFEAAWRSGGRPRIEDFLQAYPAEEHPDAARTLLIELVMTDLEQRWRVGSVAATQRVPPKESAAAADPGASALPSQPRLEHYVGRYPELGPVESLPGELIAFEYRARQLWGDRPQHAEYLARFKDRAATIKGNLGQVDEELRDAGRACGTRPLPSAVDGKTEEHEPSRAVDAKGLCAGARLDHYVIQECLGAGGMATVYLAHDEQLDRQVAVKVPHAACSDQQSELFLEEARAVAKLKHPG